MSSRYIVSIAVLSLLIIFNGFTATTIQRGNVILASGSSTVSVSIAAVNMSKTILVFQSSCASPSPRDYSVTGQITTTTTLTFSRNGASSFDANIHWQVVQDDNMTVQRGSITDLASATNNITITAVDLTKTFVLISMRNHDTATEDNNYLSTRLTSPTNLELKVRRNSSGAQGVEWQVVEYSGAAVQRGTVAFPIGTSVNTAAIVAVDLSRSFLLYSWEGYTTTVIMPNDAAYHGQFNSSTQVQFDREGTSGEATLSWEVIEFIDPTIVITGTSAFAAGDLVKDITIPVVDMARTFTLMGGQAFGGQCFGKSPKNDDDVYGMAMATAELTSSTNVKLIRNTSGFTADFTCFIIQLAGTILPIELLSFTGTNKGSYNMLEWQTASETNNDYFTIERAASPNLPPIGGEEFNWEVIGMAAGAGNSTTTLSYNFIDHSPYTPLIYYRLKQTDFNGNYTYSNIIVVEAKINNSTLVSDIYPNPANVHFTFTYRGDSNRDLEIVIYNAMTQRVMEMRIEEPLHLSQQAIKTETLPSGVYWVQFFEKGYRQQTHKLSIVK